MRVFLIAAFLIATLGAPAWAQRNEPVERRIDRIEQQLRAVQRRVFPDGRVQFVEPEIQPGQTNVVTGVSGDALASVSARLDSVESQLRNLTGQVEEQGNRLRQLEAQMASLTAEQERRAATPPPAASESAPAESTPAAEPADSDTAEPAQAAGDPAEEAYNAGYRLWNSGRNAEAQQALEAAATRYPDSRWTSWMRNLLGRAHLDDDKPATAARIFLDNYQQNPRGERAADSLFFLGQALTQLDRLTEACRVYDELEQVYPSMRDFLRQRLPQARTAARCGAASR